MRIAVVGLGYWGPNLVRNLLQLPEVQQVVMVDRDPARLASATRKFPTARAVAELDPLLERGEVDAVILATPLSTHYEMGKRVLLAGCHLLVEKPFSETSAQAEELILLAGERGRVLMVDHTFLYTGAVRKIRDLLKDGRIGRMLYFDSVRVNLGLFQHDTNVVWDLAPHDLSILDHLVDATPSAVQAVGSRHYYGYEDMAYLTVFYPDELMAHFHVNWIAPVKVRRILIGGDRQMIVFDDMDPSEKIKVYDKGVELSRPEDIWQTLVSYRTGDMWAPKIDMTEALAVMLRDFIACIQAGGRPLADARSALNVVCMLEAAEMSLRQGGRRVELSELPRNQEDKHKE